jgi:hypothetical protein
MPEDPELSEDRIKDLVQELDKMRSHPTQEEMERAVRHLMEKIPRSTLEQVWRKMQEDPGWWVLAHHGFGTGIRNTLREGGFTWDAQTLDGTWMMLVGEAARRNVGPTSNSPCGSSSLTYPSRSVF